MHNDNRFRAVPCRPKGLIRTDRARIIKPPKKAAGNRTVTRIANRRNIISKRHGFENYIYLDPINTRQHIFLSYTLQLKIRLRIVSQAGKFTKTTLLDHLLRTLLAFGVLLTALPLPAAHIIGGEITYQCLGWTNGDPATNSRTYRFSMYIYRDCQGGGALFDSAPGAPYQASVTIYLEGQSNPVFNFTLGQPTITYVDPNPGNPCVLVPANVCVEQGKYSFPPVDLPVSDKSYFIVYQRCCRNNTITNIVNPGGSGASYFMELTPAAQAVCNNSPTYNGFPPVVLCANEPFEFDHSASDPEGDQLVYEFCAPFLGGGLNFNNPYAFDGVAPNPDAPPPYNPVTFVAPYYSALDPLGINADININVNTGLITGVPQNQGQFVVGVCVKEYRNGQLLSKVFRDFQFNVTTCDPTVVADIREDAMINGSEFLLTRCGDTRINFVNQSYQQAYIDQYRWVFDLGGRDTVINSWNAVVNFPGVGEYDGRLYLNPGTECGDTARIVVRIFPDITAEYSYDYDTCIAGPVSFRDLSAGAAPINNWSWAFGDGQGSSNQHAEYIYREPGFRQVSLRVTDVNGCRDSITKEIEYFPVPALLIISPSAFTGCAPGTIFFDNLSTPINEDYDILWDFGDGGTASDISPEYTFAREGTFSIGLSVVSPIGCQTDTVFSNLISIEPSPVADFSYSPQALDNFNPEVQFTDKSSGASKWYWDFEGVAYATGQNPRYTFRDTGLQEVRLVVTHPSGCRDTTVQQIDVVPKVTYFLPNAFTPNDDSANDVFLGKGYLRGVTAFEMSIWNRWGEEIFRSEDPMVGWNGRKNNTGSLLPAGVYYCLVRYTGPRGEATELRGVATLVQ